MTTKRGAAAHYLERYGADEGMELAQGAVRLIVARCEEDLVAALAGVHGDAGVELHRLAFDEMFKAAWSFDPVRYELVRKALEEGP